MNRRDFISGTAFLAAAGFVPAAKAMNPDEQKAHDLHAAAKVDKPAKLLDSAPFLQVPAETSVGVAFAVTAFSLGKVEDKPDWHPSFACCASFSAYRKLQAEWLADQFNRPEIANAPHVVAFCHIPLFDANPETNPGDRLEDWADWRKDCAELWGPVFDRNRVKVVIAGHKHYYRCDVPAGGRNWTQICGGGPGDGQTARHGHVRYPTFIGGEVVDGKLVITVFNALDGLVVAKHVFEPRV